nr:MAG TPA: hypothetical protein [Bacteriophage sp.]
MCMVYLNIYRYRVQKLTDDQVRDGHSTASR